MMSVNAPDILTRFFLQQVRKLLHEDRGVLQRTDIAPVERLPNLRELAAYAPAGKSVLSRTVVIKLNGGLGTSMGLETTKSLLKAKDGYTFLDIAFRQVEYLRRRYRCRLPLVLMNSFYTEAETAQALRQKKAFMAAQAPIPIAFTQHRVPKLNSQDYLPAQCPNRPECEWCPPGHGDLYLALTTSGLLDVFLDSDIEYAFVSNSDNLGAVLDVALLGFLAAREVPFVMEVTRRTPADRKGGHLARLQDGRLALREIAQCPEDEIDDFMDVDRYRFFNTNNIWLNLRMARACLDRAGGFFDLPLIVNRKPVNPSDASSPAVLQLECAMGAAIQVFPGAQAIEVPRERFSPVKTTEDLLALWSDAYVLLPSGQVVLHSDRHGVPVIIQLDRKFYGTYGDFEARFFSGPPSLRKCAKLVVSGDIRFGADITCCNEVVCENTKTEPVQIPSGSCLEGSLSF
jgi:UTP--glucose-1-phosphate uridylyltransferase